MSNKMLIDASHPEETRVAVVRGNRVEEFDFESQEKKQLRGNIYLAKVTRVEPSLQAAFVDYGGNRHGFLAFSEIHPDYYQIPVADRQALLEAEAEEARASREAEDDEDEKAALASDNADAESDEDEKPKKKPRRRRTRKAKTTEDSDAAENAEEPETVAEEKSADDVADDTAVEEPEEKPKRRSTRRKKAPVAKKADDAEEEAPASSDDDDGETPSGTMAAIVETDSISEPLPEDVEADEDNDDASEDEPVAEEKPKRRSTRRKAAPKKKAATETEETSPDEEPKSESGEEEEEEKPKKKPTRRRTSRKKPSKESEAKEEESDDAETNSKDLDQTEDSDGNGDLDDDSIESVGQEDALEEVPTPRRQRRHYKIQEVIKRRQVLLVQVVKEERGTKGAALTTYLSLAGRYSVLMPNTARGGGISRKITNAADRKRLKAIASELDVPQGMGVILRTAGASRTNAEIERDFDYLMRLWEQVRALTLSSTAPCLVYEEGSLIKRSIRDLYDKDTGEVLVAGENGFNEAKEFMTMLMPSAAKKVKQHRDKQSIFAKFGVETQLDKMVTPQVTLKSGGYLIIDQTEALVAVDVNSGRSTREHSIENTALNTNLEAAEEVARQLRLRDLAGLIVIDFIDMEEKRNNRAVEKKLKECLKNDRARIQVGRISHFGLLEMSRQRMRASVLESTMDVCSLCGGTGHVRSDSAIALHVFRAIEEHVSKHNRFDAVIKTTPAIAIHLLNHKRASLLDLERRYGLNVLIEGSSEITGQDFTIEKGDPARGERSSNAIGYQNDAASENTDDAGDEEKGRRGNKRGRGRRNSQDDDSESVKSTGTEDTVEASDGEDDDKPRKKRRRGKRGGRRRKDEGSEAPAQEASEQSAEQPAMPSDAEPKPEVKTEEAVEEPKDVEPEKPKRRSTTRRKAPVSKSEPVEDQPKAEQVAETLAEETKAETAEEKPPRRRTTRRVKPSDETADGELAAESGEGEKKKRGWWNKGGGFF